MDGLRRGSLFLSDFAHTMNAFIGRLIRGSDLREAPARPDGPPAAGRSGDDLAAAFRAEENFTSIQPAMLATGYFSSLKIFTATQCHCQMSGVEPTESEEKVPGASV
nr:hypothetical protein BaRGS_009083 [Batillaria attramentaria]